jgi:hypothetical protein
VLVAAAAAAIVSAFCGGNDSSPTTTPTPTPPAPTPRSTQNPTGSTANWDAQTSQTGSGASSVQVFDDFTFTTATTVRSVAWQGIYCRKTVNAPESQPTATAFVVAFHADQNGQPVTTGALQTASFPVAQVAQTRDTAFPGRCGTADPTTYVSYGYGLTLPTPFAAAANTRYWFSVQATTPNFDVYWGWRNGTSDNNRSLQLFQGAFTTFNLDRAFSLNP